MIAPADSGIRNQFKVPVNRLLAEIRQCRICEADLTNGTRPILQVSSTARLCIASQAPGLRAHNTGKPFNDASGQRLREWMGIGPETFYDKRKVAIIPMAFCFPGYTPTGSDKPPPRVCADKWREQLFSQLPHLELTLLVGSYAQAWHLRGAAKKNLTETVKAWREFSPRFLPLPHPSWHNNRWIRLNPWFDEDVLPYLRRRVHELCSEKSEGRHVATGN